MSRFADVVEVVSPPVSRLRGKNRVSGGGGERNNFVGLLVVSTQSSFVTSRFDISLGTGSLLEERVKKSFP